MTRLEAAKAELAEIQKSPFIPGEENGEHDIMAECWRNRQDAELEGEIRGLEREGCK